MLVKQISVFIQDEEGRLAEICELLGEAGINIKGFTVSDTAEGYGLFRLLTDDYEKASDLLVNRGFTVSQNEIITAKIPNVPGGLANVLKIFSKKSLNIEYMYATAGTLIAFKINNNEKAIKALKEAGIEIISRSDFISM